MKPATTTKPKKYPEYTVIRDSREQAGNGWIFAAESECLGTEIATLKTGDYSIKGMEKRFCIERKKNTGEFAKNILEKRFDAELLRMESFDYPFLVLEFTMADLMSYPINSGIPARYHYKIKVSKALLLSKLLEYQCTYKVKIIFAGSHGKEIAQSLFRKMALIYEKDKSTKCK